MAIISALILDASDDSNTFFVCLYRSEDVREGSFFSIWLNTLEEACPVQPIKMDNLTPFCVNEMVSETLQTFPRFTRPLSSILFVSWTPVDSSISFIHNLTRPLATGKVSGQSSVSSAITRVSPPARFHPHQI